MARSLTLATRRQCCKPRCPRNRDLASRLFYESGHVQGTVSARETTVVRVHLCVARDLDVIGDKDRVAIGRLVLELFPA